MRYYRIVVSSTQTLAAGGALPAVTGQSSNNNILTFTSHPNGLQQPPDEGALLVEMDLYVSPAHTDAGTSGSYVRIWGIPISLIGQSNQLNGQYCAVYGGMGKGLPLANPSQAGLLIQGTVQLAFANWIGTTMTLEIDLLPASPAGGPATSQGISFNAPAGTPLSTAIQAALSAAFPNYTLSMQVSQNLVLPNTETHFAGTLSQFATYVNGIARKIAGQGAMLGPWATLDDVARIPPYQGISIYADGNALRVTDGTQPKNAPKTIAFNDLIGQPTWIGYNEISVTCVMRGDINVGDYVTLPETRATITPQVAQSVGQQGTSPLVNNVLFQGNWLVGGVHHVGNYKDPSALSWVTVLDCTGGATVGGGGTASVPLTG